MKNKVFVNNLPWKIDDQALGDFFSQFGNVKSSQVVMDHTTGKARGFGFVEFTDNIADQVIEKANGIDLEGRKLMVKLAIPKENRR